MIFVVNLYIYSQYTYIYSQYFLPINVSRLFQIVIKPNLFSEMTINYHKEIKTSHTWKFFVLLFRWKGSIWKAIYMETIIFLICYGIISVVYRTAMSEPSQRLVLKENLVFNHIFVPEHSNQLYGTATNACHSFHWNSSLGSL